MKQAAFNREFRLAENFSIKHIINHPSHLKRSLCSFRVARESAYWLAAVAPEEATFFRSAKEGSVVRKSPSAVQLFPLVSAFANGESSPHWLFGLRYDKKCHHGPCAARHPGATTVSTGQEVTPPARGGEQAGGKLRGSTATCCTVRCILRREGLQEAGNPTQPLTLFTGPPLADLLMLTASIPSIWDQRTSSSYMWSS